MRLHFEVGIMRCHTWSRERHTACCSEPLHDMVEVVSTFWLELVQHENAIIPVKSIMCMRGPGLLTLKSY